MEQEFISWLRTRVPPHRQLALGPGDDAAVLDVTPGSQLVVTSDLLTDKVDFLCGQCTGQQIGRKALAVNLSDLAAMAARPVAAIVSLALPRGGAAQWARSIYEGILPLADQFDVALAGGDTNTWDGDLVISVTALGETTARGPLCRSGARPGDLLLATGQFGGSLLEHQFSFTPRVREALLLHQQYELHAGIDVSDGLSLDAARLAAESGCGLELHLDQIPIRAAAVALAERDQGGPQPLDRALGDGEDFELLLAVPPEAARQLLADQPLDVPLTCLGQFVARAGIQARWPDGSCRPLVPRGWLH